MLGSLGIVPLEKTNTQDTDRQSSPALGPPTRFSRPTNRACWMSTIITREKTDNLGQMRRIHSFRLLCFHTYVGVANLGGLDVDVGAEVWVVLVGIGIVGVGGGGGIYWCVACMMACVCVCVCPSSRLYLCFHHPRTEGFLEPREASEREERGSRAYSPQPTGLRNIFVPW